MACHRLGVKLISRSKFDWIHESKLQETLNGNTCSFMKIPMKMASAQCRLFRSGFTILSNQQKVGRSATRWCLDIMILHTVIQWQEQNINQISKLKRLPTPRPYGRAVGCLLWGFCRKLISRYNGTLLQLLFVIEEREQNILFGKTMWQLYCVLEID